MRLKLVGVFFVAAAMATLGWFLAARLLPQGAAESPQSIAEEQRRLLEEDKQKPIFSGVVNGIRLYNAYEGPERKSICVGAEAKWVPIERAQGSPLDIVPSYLPPGTGEAEGEAKAVECNGVLAVVERIYDGPGGVIQITRFEGEHAMDVLAPADRIKPATIRGKKAVVIEPIFPGDLAYAIVAEEFGVTTANGNVPLDVLVKVIEGLQ